MKIAANFIQTDFGGNFKHAGKVQVCKLMLIFPAFLFHWDILPEVSWWRSWGWLVSPPSSLCVQRGSDGLGGIYLEVSNAFWGIISGQWWVNKPFTRPYLPRGGRQPGGVGPVFFWKFSGVNEMAFFSDFLLVKKWWLFVSFFSIRWNHNMVARNKEQWSTYRSNLYLKVNVFCPGHTFCQDA